MKIALIGGAGFIGANLCETLLAQGHTVHVFDHPNSKNSYSDTVKKQVLCFEGDFLNPENISCAILGCEVVFHLVSTTLPKTSNENPIKDVNENVIGTIRLMDECIKHGIRKIIFISSGGTVYGKPTYVPMDEAHPTNPLCSYGITKLMIEKYMGLYRELHSLDCIVLRLSNPFGKYQRAIASQGVIAVFLGKVLRNECIDIWGDGSVVRDYIYISDVMDAMLAAIEYDGHESLFNIGSGQGMSLLDIIETIEHVTGHSVEHRFMQGRSFDVPVNILAIDKAKSEFGWVPKVAFNDGVMRMFDWFKGCGSNWS